MNTSIVGGNKEVRDVAALWVEQGYTVEPNKGGHLTVRDKEGNFVTSLPNSPSDHRWRKNALSLFRRTIRARGSQEAQEVTETMVGTKTNVEIPERQVELSQRVFATLKERGWPHTMNVRGEFIAEAMNTAREMYGVENSPWGSEGSAQAALTDLLSGKRIVSHRGLDIFDYITTPQGIDPEAQHNPKKELRGVAKTGRSIEYAAEADWQKAVEEAALMINEIDQVNSAGIRKGHKLNFGTMKYAAVWADRTVKRTGYQPNTRNGKENHEEINSWTTRLRDLAFNTEDVPRMTADTVADVLYITGQWAKASEQEKWQYLNDPRMGNRHRISVPEGVRQVDPVPETPAPAVVSPKIVEEVLAAEPDTRAMGFPVGEPESRVDTGDTIPLHMRVLWAIARPAEHMSPKAAMELADEVRKLEEK